MAQSSDLALPVAGPELQQDATFLIADVSELTGVPPPQLRSWEEAGILHPRRSPNATRLYSVEDVARVRLIKRSLLKPGRRGSLRRIAKDLAGGTLVTSPEDFAGLPCAPEPRAISDAAYWQAVVAAMDVLVVVCDSAGRMTSMNPALRSLLPSDPGASEAGQPARSLDGEPLPAILEALPLRWSAVTGTQHRDVVLTLPGTAHAQVQTSWEVTPLRDEGGAVIGAVAMGRIVPPTASLLPEDWLAVAAHDMRNPVTAVLGRLQLARLRSASLASSAGPAARELDLHLAAAERSTENLIRVMDTVLDASAAARGALLHHLEPEGVDLRLVAEQAVEHAQRQASRHTVTMSTPSTGLVVAGDRVRLRQVLDNLLANAIKYSPDGGDISLQLDTAAALTTLLPSLDGASEVVVDPAGGWVSVRIADTGLGMPAAALPHVFERYWRVTDTAQGIRGTGLGLYVCRAIVAAHGGHIWVERSVSVAESAATADGWHGTVMVLVLPRAASAAQPDLPGKRDAAGQTEVADAMMAVQ
jgi:signal transduction histidine kinase